MQKECSFKLVTEAQLMRPSIPCSRLLQTLQVGISGAVLTFPRLIHHLDGQRREVATTESESALADALTFGGDAVLLTEATYAYRS